MDEPKKPRRKKAAPKILHGSFCEKSQPKRAKVRYRRPYQIHQTFASMMLSAGEHPMWVAQQMGHKGRAPIIRVYGK